MEVGLTVREAVTDIDAEYMRLIRNECREFMTRETKRIPPWKQRIWWKKLDRKHYRPYLLEKNGLPVGYGLIRYEGNERWLSGGLSKDHRGKGWGSFLFSCLTNLAGSNCWLEVRSDNTPAVRVYTSLGFVEVKRQGDIITMRRQCQ